MGSENKAPGGIAHDREMGITYLKQLVLVELQADLVSAFL